MSNQYLELGRRGFMPQLADVVSEARRLIGWSQRELAHRAQTSQATIWRMERGRSERLDLLDDFVEIGVDVLNPVQASAGGMSDFAGLKRRFGDRLVFCGGMDTHRVLPHGTPDEVRAEVRRVIDTLGPGGGLMLGAVHTVMGDVPPENVLAMVDEAVAYGTYPRRG